MSAQRSLFLLEITNHPVCAAKERDLLLMAQPPLLGKEGNGSVSQPSIPLPRIATSGTVLDRNPRKECCSLAFQPESTRTALFVHFQAGICSNNVVRSLPGRNLLQQRCSIASRPESTRTTLFAHFPAGICSN